MDAATSPRRAAPWARLVVEFACDALQYKPNARKVCGNVRQRSDSATAKEPEQNQTDTRQDVHVRTSLLASDTKRPPALAGGLFS